MTTVAAEYLLGGIVLASELPLPELPLRAPEAAVFSTVDVRIGEIPSTLFESTEIDPDCFANPDRFLLRVKGIAGYLVSCGKEIVVQPEEGAPAADVRAYLLGIVFSVLCHQRGLLPLHASAVSTPHGVVAFLARSGEGKSSLAAHLAKRGFPVVSDDICLVDASSVQGEVTVIPAAPWLKLWRASLQELGQPAEGLQRVFSEDDKYRFPVEPIVRRQSLSKLIFLERSEAGPVEIQEMTGVRTVAALMNFVHQSYLLEAMNKRQEVFMHCGRVLSRSKVYRFVRPWGFTHMELAMDKLEGLLRTDFKLVNAPPAESSAEASRSTRDAS